MPMAPTDADPPSHRPEGIDAFEIDLDRDASLADLTERLAADGVNLLGVATEIDGDRRKALLIPDDPRRAREILETEGIDPRTTDPLVLPLSDEPGALDEIAKRLDEGQVRIRGSFVKTDANGDRVGIGLYVDDPDRARQLIGQ